MVHHLSIYTAEKNPSSRSEPMHEIMHDMLSASTFSPSKSRNAPPTACGGRASMSKTLIRRHGGPARKVTHHAHDFETSVRLLFLDGETPTSQRRGATLHVAHKSAKELPSLASFSNTLPYHSRKYAFWSKAPRYG
jgi:hypothetical protein